MGQQRGQGAFGGAYNQHWQHCEDFGPARRTAGVNERTDPGHNWLGQDQSRYHLCTRVVWLVVACMIALFYVYNSA